MSTLLKEVRKHKGWVPGVPEALVREALRLKEQGRKEKDRKLASAQTSKEVIKWESDYHYPDF